MTNDSKSNHFAALSAYASGELNGCLAWRGTLILPYIWTRVIETDDTIAERSLDVTSRQKRRNKKRESLSI